MHRRANPRAVRLAEAPAHRHRPKDGGVVLPPPLLDVLPPPGFTPYPQQKPGTSYFPSDRDAVYVVSEGKFGSYACP